MRVVLTEWVTHVLPLGKAVPEQIRAQRYANASIDFVVLFCRDRMSRKYLGVHLFPRDLPMNTRLARGLVLRITIPS